MHQTVLLREAVAGLNIHDDSLYIDATFGRGGHSRAIFQKLGPHGKLLAFDRDPSAATSAAYFHQEINQDPRFEFIQTPFSALGEVIQARGLQRKVAGILFDLGVSSPQLDEAERGFSFRADGPLDMRMDPTSGQSAAEWIAYASQDEMADIFRLYGEERFAGRIARHIVEQRAVTPFTRTSQLADLIAQVSPTREKQKHPATRVFQAIRIHVNQELQEIRVALQASLLALQEGGRLAVISFHSLEDRIAKQFIKQHSERAEIPAGLPIRDDQIADTRTLKRIGKAIKPSAEEVAANPRSRSSILRVAQRLNHD